MTTKPITQARLDEVQAAYREWLTVSARLEASQQDWQKAAELMGALQRFYYDEYMDYHDAAINDQQIDTTTQGEYSVTSEDAIWNALHDYQQLLWTQLRMATHELDPDNQPEPVDAFDD